MSPFVTARVMTSRVRNCAGHTVSNEGYGYGEPELGLYAVANMSLICVPVTVLF